MNRNSLFIIDDEKTVREGIALALNHLYKIKIFESAEKAIDAISEFPPDLILLDIGLGGIDGIEALKIIKKINSDILVVMITAYESVDTVVNAMKLGAYDYVVKPVHIEPLLVTINNALESIAMRQEIQRLQESNLKEHQPWFICESDSMQNIMDIVNRVAKSPDTPILIEGKTGTGKELIANTIHYRSPNFKAPFVAVNCAAFPGELIESELFGYEKGAFTGASSTGKTGLVEQATGGTFFLDEVGDLSLAAQTKLLRFLESGEFYKVGGNKVQRAVVRIVSATNRDLAQMVTDGLFRNDLYFRLAVVKLTVPSLNKRPEDILPIAKHFLLEFGKKFNNHFESISPEAEKVLKQYKWAGNIRELKNMIERSVLIAKGPVLKPEDIGVESIEIKYVDKKSNTDTVMIPETGLDYLAELAAIEMRYFKEALTLAKGNESKAARLLNLSRDKFRYRKEKLTFE